ncbi:P-loop containing nucleoside triphosphate hydrolase protein [Colletotrichum zoysiae]|uniref:P-loop containing nucleoside triphosphate hydrolase protein n=1 Tax=Colletotrichum zoysiae TaxID=1216348 RepID=A0AAD9HLU3_9PEZI|nr:P-loop containing nucleoside triphosphate hydrolase protein [Colletotrichum zoysiae]
MTDDERQPIAASGDLGATNITFQEKSSASEPELILGHDETNVLQQQIASPTSWDKSARFLLSCTSSLDGTILILSTIAAVVGGAANPFAMLLLGNMGQSFRGFFIGDTALEDFNREVNQLSLFYVYLAIVEFVAIYAATVGFAIAGERIAQRIRERYLAAILRQNIAYFDGLGVGEVNTRLTTDINLIQDAITGKASATLSAIATFVSALIISFIKSWVLTLIVFPAQILIVGAMGVGAKFMIKYTVQSHAAYAPGMSLAEEAIGSVRGVTAYGMQETLVRRYQEHVAKARKAGFSSGVALACLIAAMNGIIFWSYGLAFWQGARYLVQGRVSLSAILTILFANITGAFALGNISPHTQAFVNGITATDKISQTCCRQPPIDSSLCAGRNPKMCGGAIELRNVRHVYPSRQTILVLDNFSHFFPPGKTTALVGSSGCGKSTIVGLLERFYRPVRGQIFLDGIDISTLDVSWLRQQIGLVSQDPTLFSATIFENIRLGLVGSAHENLQDELAKKMVEDAARVANAYDFIMALPDGFATKVGDSGSLLSGGQKQRIAIARAIVGDPKILILDEATSALDAVAERHVQEALQMASQGRTTIAIAHRLTTISAADNIIVMSKGRIVEQGTHAELMEQRAVYFDMFQQQSVPVTTHQDTPDMIPDQRHLGDEFGSVQRSSDAEERHTEATIALLQHPQEPTTIRSLALFVHRLNKGNDLLILLGLVFSVVAGASHPAQSVFLAKIIATMSVKSADNTKILEKVNFWCWMYFMIGFTTLFGWLGQGVCFALYSVRLTQNARVKGLETILNHDMALFLRDDHSTAALTSVLSSSAANLQGLSGAVLGTLVVVSTTLIAGFVLATAIGWKLALVCATTTPIQLACGIVRLKCVALLEGHSRRVYESSATYACEYSSNIRTVAALNLEPKIQRDYHQLLEEQRKRSLTSISQSSLLYAASQSLNFLCASLAFWYGSRLVATENYTMFQFFVCYTAVIAGAYSAGAIFSFAPDIGKARDSAARMQALFRQPVSIDVRTSDGSAPSKAERSITLRNVSFTYPSRPDRLVLDNVNISVRPGQYIALVGGSGSGKSTVISLLERFFDPDQGQIIFASENIKDWNLKNYRRQLGLVSQSPTLFDGTIRDNIVFGVEDEKPSEEAVTRACRDANIYDFVSSLPDGFNTVVGARGAMLSGGQRQRITIARALLRNPKVLLLDEATSALDSESEKVVQEALDAAARGRTTIAVAHRISTVKHADCIYVLDRGRVVEEGTHQALMEANGKYSELVKLQSFNA